MIDHVGQHAVALAVRVKRAEDDGPEKVACECAACRGPCVVSSERIHGRAFGRRWPLGLPARRRGNRFVGGGWCARRAGVSQRRLQVREVARQAACRRR